LILVGGVRKALLQRPEVANYLAVPLAGAPVLEPGRNLLVGHAELASKGGTLICGITRKRWWQRKDAASGDQPEGDGDR
jgi:hypothetical protein